MAIIASTALALRFFGDDLDPAEVTALLGAKPTHARRKGDVRRHKNGRKTVARSGTWQLDVPDREPGDLSGQLEQLFSRLTPDLSVWRALASRYQADVYCGLFMDRRGESEELVQPMLAALGERGLSLGLELYDPSRDEQDLLRHPDSEGSGHLVAYVDYKRHRSGELDLRFVLRGDVSAVRMAPPSEPARADDLWRTTCFEVFVLCGDGAYFEFNLSPSSEWAAYRLGGYRSGMVQATIPKPRIYVQNEPRRLQLNAELRLSELPELAGRSWKVGVSAVVEDVSGAISYWALAHPPGKPDFHHPDSFVLELPA